MVQTAALDGIVQLTGAVAGQNRHGCLNSFDSANFWNADLILAQIFEQKRFKRLVSAVNLVNQQDRAWCGCLQCLQQRAANQVAVLVDLTLHVSGTGLAFSRLHVQQLRGVIPFVQRFPLFQPVIALQANQLALQRFAQGFGQLGFADTGLALKQQRALELEGQEHSGCQAAISKISGFLQRSCQVINGLKKNHLLLI